MRLKELRNTAGLSQKKLAEKLHLHQNTIRDYEANIIMPSVEVLKNIAILFNVSTDYLLCFDNRTPLYLDDIPKKDKETIVKIVDPLKNSYMDRDDI